MENKDLLVNMYYQMLRIRRVEERLIKLWELNKLRSLMHLSTGQEAVAVGVCSALTKNDSVVSTHRCHAHYLAKGGDVGKMIAELAGKVDGCSRGRGGSMHLFDESISMNLSLPIVASTIPIAVGIGMSIKFNRENRVSVAFFGDGAVEEGVFWESLNFAIVKNLPVIFVCENNTYATHSHILTRQPSDEIARRVAGYGGIYSVKVDGNKVEGVYQQAYEVITRARNGNGPCFIEAVTYRTREHWGPGEDWHLGYRSKEEGDFWKRSCPIKLLRAKLDKGINAGIFQSLEDKIENEIDAAVIFASNSAAPTKEEFYG